MPKNHFKVSSLISFELKKSIRIADSSILSLWSRIWIEMALCFIFDIWNSDCLLWGIAFTVFLSSFSASTSLSSLLVLDNYWLSFLKGQFSFILHIFRELFSSYFLDPFDENEALCWDWLSICSRFYFLTSNFRGRLLSSYYIFTPKALKCILLSLEVTVFLCFLVSCFFRDSFW